MTPAGYKESVALVECKRGLGMVAELLQLESKYSDPPPPADEGAVAGLRGGAAVLMVASFEGFIRDVLLERVDEIRARNVPLSRLPQRMQVHAAFALLERTMKGPPHHKAPPKAQRLPDVLSAGLLLGKDGFRAEVFGDTRSNPGPETVVDVFYAIGIDNIFSKIRKEYDVRIGAPSALRFLEDKLEEIVKRRNAIAHTGSVGNVSRSQLAEAHNFLLLLSQLLDEELYSYSRAIT